MAWPGLAHPDDHAETRRRVYALGELYQEIIMTRARLTPDVALAMERAAQDRQRLGRH
jgi:hypothetical protein